MQPQQTNLLPLLLVIVLAVLLLRQPGPDPSPIPPRPTPIPDSPIRRIVRDLVQRLIPGSTRVAEARSVARVYRDLAAEIETLRDPLSPSKLKRPADPIREADRRIRTTLGARWEAWIPVHDQLADALAELDQRGEIGRTIYAVGDVFHAIAVGLEEVR